MRAALVILGLLFGTAAHAQTIELRRPPAPPALGLKIKNGIKAVPINWPATYIFDGVDGKPCTATAVGPRVLLTAAHCLATDASGTIRDTKVRLWCGKPVLHGHGSDVALCATSGLIPIASGKPYESLDLQTRPTAGALMMMLGYGCTAKGGTGGVLYEGLAKVGDFVTAGRQFQSSGTPALCSGDSGGGAYAPVGVKRRIIGVASDVTGDVSRFSLLSHAEIVEFVTKWQSEQVDPATKAPIEVKICGIDGSSAYCRG